MKKFNAIFTFCFVAFAINVNFATAQEKMLPVQYEELSAPEFIQALDLSEKTCIIPLGILEKHGAHLPIGTDLLDSREIALRAAKTEYAVVFPHFYFGQIFEARHQPGTIAYSADLIWKILEETCDELGRNGFQKIILVNGHGGNASFVQYFCQAQLAIKKNYAVILFVESDDLEVNKKIESLRKTTGGGHADEIETSMLFSHRPDLVHIEHAKEQSGKDLDRISYLKNAYTGIWWYASFPNHYAGDGSVASKEIGDLALNSSASQLVDLLKSIKTDKTILELQQEFYKKAENPIQTKQEEIK
jgi:creatinine amidohydrolase